MEQPILDTLNADNLISEKPDRFSLNFEKCTIDDLKHVKLAFTHKMTKTALLHGYVLFFDAYFDGADKPEVLYTGPTHAATHWY